MKEFEVVQSDHETSEYEHHIYTNVYPKIVKPSLGRRFSLKTQEIFKNSRVMFRESVKGIAVGVAIAAVAVAGAHLVGLHLAGLHAARAIHVLAEVAYAVGAVSLGSWMFHKTVPKTKLDEGTVVREKITDKKTLDVQDSDSDSSSSRSFTFKSFFLGIKARLSSPSLTTAAPSQNTFKK